MNIPQGDMFRRGLPDDVPMPPDPGGGHSYHFVQDTSLEAYRRFLDEDATDRQERIIAFLQSRGWYGATNDEGWRAMGFPTPNSYAPNITHLKKEGVVVWRGDYRLTAANRKAKVWVTARAWIEHHRRDDDGEQRGVRE